MIATASKTVINTLMSCSYYQQRKILSRGGCAPAADNGSLYPKEKLSIIEIH